MRVVSSSSESEHAGCDAVEVYFDPEGQESVADRLVREGYFVAHQTDTSEPQSQKVGTKVSKSPGDPFSDAEDADSENRHLAKRHQVMEFMLAMMEASDSLNEQ